MPPLAAALLLAGVLGFGITLRVPQALLARPFAGGTALGVILVFLPYPVLGLPPNQGSITHRWLLADHLGSAVVVMGPTGAVIHRRVFEPFGGIYRETAQPTEASRQRFTGKELSPASSLYDFDARWYDSEIGRFVSVDAVIRSSATPQSFNAFSYVENMPLSMVDPSGRVGVDAAFAAEFGRSLAGLQVDAWKGATGFASDALLAAGVGAKAVAAAAAGAGLSDEIAAAAVAVALGAASAVTAAAGTGAGLSLEVAAAYAAVLAAGVGSGQLTDALAISLLAAYIASGVNSVGTFFALWGEIVGGTRPGAPVGPPAIVDFGDTGFAPQFVTGQPNQARHFAAFAVMGFEAGQGALNLPELFLAGRLLSLAVEAASVPGNLFGDDGGLASLADYHLGVAGWDLGVAAGRGFIGLSDLPQAILDQVAGR